MLAPADRAGGTGLPPRLAVPGAGDGHCWPSPDQEILLAAALLDGPRGDAAWATLRAGLDVGALDHASQAVLPLLYRRLKSAGVDDPLMGLFKGIHRYNWARNQALIEAFMPVLRQLAAAGIATALLKGAALVATTYVDPGLRAMVDLDLLVPMARRRVAIDILTAGGLVPVSGLSPDAVDQLAPTFSPSFGFRNPQGRELDLHWQVLHQSRQADADDDFWAAMRDVPFRGLAMRALDPADQLLHVITHGLRWNLVPPLRWVVDAMMILRQPASGFDPMRLVEQARRRRLVVPVRQALDYLRQRFDAPVPAAAIAALRRSPTSFLERREARLMATDPAGHRPVDRAILDYQDIVRKRTPLGGRPDWGVRLAALAEWRGLDTVSQLPADLLLRRPGLPHRPAPGPRAVLAEGARLAATAEAGFYRLAGHGWSVPEAHGTWSIRRQAQIRLLLAERSGLPLALTFAGHLFAVEGLGDQRLVVAINGRRLGEWPARPGGPALVPARVVIPSAAAAGIMDLRFAAARLGSPRDFGLGADTRHLGFFLNWLSVAPVPPLGLGERIDFTDMAADAFLAGGWVRTAAGVEIDGAARLVLRLAGRPPARLRLQATLRPAGASPSATLTLVVNRRRVARWPMPAATAGATVRSAIVPAGLLGRESVATIELRDDHRGQARSGPCLSTLVIDRAP